MEHEYKCSYCHRAFSTEEECSEHEKSCVQWREVALSYYKNCGATHSPWSMSVYCLDDWRPKPMLGVPYVGRDDALYDMDNYLPEFYVAFDGRKKGAEEAAKAKVLEFAKAWLQERLDALNAGVEE